MWRSISYHVRHLSSSWTLSSSEKRNRRILRTIGATPNRTLVTSHPVHARTGISRYARSPKEGSSSVASSSLRNKPSSLASSPQASSETTVPKPIPSTQHPDILDVDESITDKEMEALEQEILSVNDDALVYTPYSLPVSSSSISSAPPTDETTKISSSTTTSDRLSSSTSPSSTVIIDQQYIAPAPGFLWLTFPESSVTLPIPSSSSSASSSSSSSSSSSPWRWSVWQGKGNFFGMTIKNTIIAPLPLSIDPSKLQLSSAGRVIDPSAASSSSVKTTSTDNPQAKYEAILKDAQNTTALSSAPILPVQIGIRYYTGLLASPFFQDTQNNNALNIGKIFIELHMMRNLPPGMVQENQTKVPPRILHTWQSTGSKTTISNNTNGTNSKIDGNDYRDILGIEYEAVSLYGTPPYRHSVTLVIDQYNDRIHEITLSTLAMEWDNLWEGNHEKLHDDDKQGVTKSRPLSSSSSSPIDQLRNVNFPSVTELSLHQQKGLQFLLNHLTVALPTLTPKKRR